MKFEITDGIRFRPTRLDLKGLRALPEGPDLRDNLPPDLRDNAAFIDRLISVNLTSERLLRKHVIKQFGFAPRIDGLSDREYVSIEVTAATAFYGFVDEFSLGILPLDVGRGVPSDEPEPESETVISLASLDLIDAERSSWEQIREFRRDVEARDKLRRLRLFAYANYQGKSKDFVEDDILTRIADYEAGVKKWSFETAQGAINMLLTSKIMGGALTGSLVSTLFGAPTMAVVAAVSGGTLEIGRITLEITKQCLALRSLMRENPVSFISYAREKLQDGSQT